MILALLVALGSLQGCPELGCTPIDLRATSVSAEATAIQARADLRTVVAADAATRNWVPSRTPQPTATATAQPTVTATAQPTQLPTDQATQPVAQPTTGQAAQPTAQPTATQQSGIDRVALPVRYGLGALLALFCIYIGRALIKRLDRLGGVTR